MTIITKQALGGCSITGQFMISNIIINCSSKFMFDSFHIQLGSHICDRHENESHCSISAQGC